jgi:Restriction endonuclease NaeI
MTKITIDLDNNDLKTANERVANCFETNIGIPILRQQIEAMARQNDPMRRIRRGGGARDLLSGMNIVVLCGNRIKDREKAASRGITLGKSQFVAVQL